MTTRFTEEAKKARNPYSYMPFGVGPRNCIGMRLALLEMKIALVKVFQRFRLVTCEKTQVRMHIDKTAITFCMTTKIIYTRVSVQNY